MKRFPTSVDLSKEPAFAVLININARGVNRAVKRSIRQMVPEGDLFISGSPEEADRFAEEIIRKRYDAVFSGGGDGSLVMLVNMLWKHVIRLNREPDGSDSLYRLPLLGILKMGTGNGWAGAVGSKKGLSQLEHALSGGNINFMPFDLIESEGRRFHFSGLGWDAQILNDFNTVKNIGKKFPQYKPFLTSLPGYLLAIGALSIPTIMFKRIGSKRTVQLKVINHGKRVFRISGARPVPFRVGRGDTIYQGEANIAGVATTPNYGFNLKAFPYAMTMPGMMNLRIIKAGVAELILNAGPIWDGTISNPAFLDYLVSEVEIQASEPVPLQIGGDAEGFREKMHYRVTGEPINVLDFSHM